MDTITTTAPRLPAPLPREGVAEAVPASWVRDTLPPGTRRPPVPRPGGRAEEAGQAFVATVRAAAPRFAAAAGAVTAVVAEAVPPARHRRARCRVVLLGRDGAETGQVFLGAPGRPAAEAAVAFTDAIARWLADPPGDQPATDVVVDPRA